MKWELLTVLWDLKGKKVFKKSTFRIIFSTGQKLFASQLEKKLQVDA